MSQKSRLGEHKFVVLCERSGCIVKKIYDLKDAKLYGADNIEVEYRPGMSFFMGHFEVRDGALYIHNKAEHPAFVCAIFKTNI